MTTEGYTQDNLHPTTPTPSDSYTAPSELQILIK